MKRGLVVLPRARRWHWRPASAEAPVTPPAIPLGSEPAAGAGTTLEPGGERPSLGGQGRTTFEAERLCASQGKRCSAGSTAAAAMANGGGGMGPALMDDKWIYGIRSANIYATIVQGGRTACRAFGGHLPDEQIWQLAAYVRSMSGKVRPTRAVAQRRHPDRAAEKAGARRCPKDAADAAAAERMSCAPRRAAARRVGLLSLPPCRQQSALRPHGVQASRIHDLWRLTLLHLHAGVRRRAGRLPVRDLARAARRRSSRRTSRALDHPSRACAAGRARRGHLGVLLVGADRGRLPHRPPLARLPLKDAVRIEVTGHMWWWGARYEDAEPNAHVRRPPTRSTSRPAGR
jgi:cytochrome c oxidase cbb3-type subunit 3